jgi:hypothetical protein
LKRTLLIALALLGMAVYDLTASCPTDGETAYFTGSRMTDGGEECNYQHTHYNQKTKSTDTHSFWVPCNR